jgi:hypothetical protein
LIKPIPSSPPVPHLQPIPLQNPLLHITPQSFHTLNPTPSSSIPSPPNPLNLIPIATTTHPYPRIYCHCTSIHLPSTKPSFNIIHIISVHISFAILTAIQHSSFHYITLTIPILTNAIDHYFLKLLNSCPFHLHIFPSPISNPLIILPPSPLLEPNSNSTFRLQPLCNSPPTPCAQTSPTPNPSLAHKPVILPPLCQVLQYSYHPPPLHTSSPAFTKPTRYLPFLIHFRNMSILPSSHYTPPSSFEKIHHSFIPSTNPEIPHTPPSDNDYVIPPSDNDYAIPPSTNQSKPGHLKHGTTTFKLYTLPFCYKPNILISSLQFPVASLPAPYIHPAHYSHFQHMISILFLTHTPQPTHLTIYTHNSTHPHYSSPTSCYLQYLLLHMRTPLTIKQSHVTKISLAMTSLLNELLSHYHLTPSIPSQCLSNTITQTYLAMIYSSLHPTATTSLQPAYDTSKPLPIHPNYNTLYKSNSLPTQRTLPHSRYFTVTLTPLHYLILALHLYILAFQSFSTTAMLPSLLTAFDHHILTILLVGNADKLTPVHVLTHPWTSFPMAPSIDLGESSGGSVRRLRLATARKKKLSLILKLIPLTGADPDPSGPIAIRDFPLDCRQLLHRKTAASDSQLVHSTQTLPKTKRRPRPNTDEDSDDFQTYSSRPPTNPTGPHTTLPLTDTFAPLLTAPMSTPQDASISSSQPPTGPPSLFYLYLWLTFSVHEIQNLQQNLPIVTNTTDMLVQCGMPASEITECLSYRHSFPRVTQALYPSVCPDALPCQYYHLTQLPFHVNIDPTTGLSPTYQIVIRFDTNYQDFSKLDVQEAAASRFEVISIPLATRFREPICAIVDRALQSGLASSKLTCSTLTLMGLPSCEENASSRFCSGVNTL